MGVSPYKWNSSQADREASKEALMEVFKVNIALGQRKLEAFVNKGVVATIETGSLMNQIRSPVDQVVIIVGDSTHGPTVWTQVSQIKQGMTQITHQGFMEEKAGDLDRSLKLFSAEVSLTRVEHPPAEVLKCLAKTSFGLWNCCTANGNGCYVRCCNGCCSDPVGCPGASCCSD